MLHRLQLVGLLVVSAASSAGAQVNQEWVTFARDPNRIQNPGGGIATQVTGDSQERSYAWGDLDHDGDLDLVIVRKGPAASTVHLSNQLLMNEGGILVDRTTQFAVDSDVPGDMGFLMPTNDRDVQVADFDGDGWLDIVTACTLSSGDPKSISHPRIYRNKGQIGGTWQGLRYEEARIPQLLDAAGLPASPRFESVSVGDLTGDGIPDLYFTDADIEGGFGESVSLDTDDKLLENDGFGFFTDTGTTRMSAAMLSDAFGAASKIIDMNGDGLFDVVRCQAHTSPTMAATSIAYQDPMNPGHFNHFQTFTSTNWIYQIDAGDLNGDGTNGVQVTWQP